MSALLDANIVLECDRTSLWRSLTDDYTIEIDRWCVAETKTGYERRQSRQRIAGILFGGS